MAAKMAKCEKCDGKGQIDWYSHVAQGVCFSCKGSGTVRGKSAATLAREAAKKAQQEANRAAVVAENARKGAKAKELYQNDRRLRVPSSDPYYYMHAVELAKCDGVWDTL